MCRHSCLLVEACFGSTYVIPDAGLAAGLNAGLLQVRLLCITDDVIPSAEATAQRMREAGIRVQVESGNLLPWYSNLCTSPACEVLAGRPYWCSTNLYSSCEIYDTPHHGLFDASYTIM